MQDMLTARLEGCYTGVVHDILRGMGQRDFTFPPELRPILPERRMAGPAFTIQGMTDANADPHRTLLEWTGLLSRAPAGHVWVCQPDDRTVALMGELSAETLMDKGIRGCLIDGYARDVEFLLAMGFQTWCRGFTPRDIVGWWLPRAVQEPITIGDVVVAPGDYILGDRDGAVRVPAALLPEVLDAAEAAIGTESKVRTAIREGMDPQAAYLAFGKF